MYYLFYFKAGGETEVAFFKIEILRASWVAKQPTLGFSSDPISRW